MSSQSRHLHHLGIDISEDDTPRCFGDVKFVCVGGSEGRMRAFAHFIQARLGIELPFGTELKDLSKHSGRCCMYKVGPVLSVSHGMGSASLSIFLNELFLLMWGAGVRDAVFVRIGTSGGIDVSAGSVVVSNGALNTQLRPYFEMDVLGVPVRREVNHCQELTDELVQLGKVMPFNVVQGQTCCAHDFYEGQGRLDGAFCSYDAADKLTYLNRMKGLGVKNIEMEATCFFALTWKAGFKAALVCVTLLNRLHGDQCNLDAKTAEDWILRPQELVAEYIKAQLAK